MDTESKRISLQAPAKINLCLQVLGRRPDGYHDLRSFMQKLELADHLDLQPAPQGVRLHCPGSDLPKDRDNLVFRAAEAFFEQTGIPAGVEITLQKRIPIAAGLGGGSSDAAAALLGLNQLFAADLSRAALHSLALSLGADVPFFIADCAAAWATGIGDRLRRAEPLRPCWILLVNPGFPVSTKWVYDNLALTTQGNPYMVGREQIHEKYDDLLASHESVAICNDLESITAGRFPEIGEIKAGLLAAGASAALMSGSGPTVFGLFREEALAVACFSRFEQQYGKNVFLTRPRHMV